MEEEGLGPHPGWQQQPPLALQAASPLPVGRTVFVNTHLLTCFPLGKPGLDLQERAHGVKCAFH